LLKTLRLHNLNTELSERGDTDIGGTIVEETEMFRASLVVMGGYGHSRFREFVMGGATRLMLRNMPAPVLMAH
jgi:nucleotide-binding universal stress UspA family protein